MSGAAEAPGALGERFRAPRDDAERDRLVTILCDAFGAPPDAIQVGMERTGAGHQRVALHDGRVIGGLWEIPMGQWFGGRSVPITGVAAVGVEAGSRGTGLGDRMMADLVTELHAREVPLSCLYPATVAFYRRAGYELAGSRHRIVLPLKGLRVKAEGTTMREARFEDEPAIEEVGSAFAAAHAGLLDRGEYIASRARQPGGKTARTWVVEQDGAITGHLRATFEPVPDLGYEVRVSDLSVTTPASVRALLAFLAGYRSMSPRAVWFGSDRHPLLLALPDFAAEVSLQMHWMIRVTHLEQALVRRGWPAGVKGEVTFELDDPLLPSQRGGWRLEVADGSARVARCDAGALRLTERGLAALYTGFASPHELQRQGLLDGAPSDRERLGALFAGPTPWMPDMF